MKELTRSHVEYAINRAVVGKSHLDPRVLEIHGFATPTMRHMFSNLCDIDGLTYLEVGVYCGATFVSAFHGNPIHAIGIDNFSQTWDPGRDIRGEFMENKNRFVDKPTKSVIFVEADCFLAPFDVSPLIDIFYFDGDHTFEAQTKALPHFIDLLADTFLFIVDDYHWPDVKGGTCNGLAKASAKSYIEHCWILHGEKAADDEIWHNGLALYLCKKHGT